MPAPSGADDFSAWDRSVAVDLRAALAEIEAFAQELGADLTTVSE
ncbi:hypothetical protein [Streptomyces sp. CA-106110]